VCLLKMYVCLLKMYVCIYLCTGKIKVTNWSILSFN